MVVDGVWYQFFVFEDVLDLVLFLLYERGREREKEKEKEKEEGSLFDPRQDTFGYIDSLQTKWSARIGPFRLVGWWK